jgi:hypothetical protein
MVADGGGRDKHAVFRLAILVDCAKMTVIYLQSSVVMAHP